MLKKLFGRSKTPSLSGSSEEVSNLEFGKFAKIFALELTNMEGSPSYVLTHQLTIGSEIGNIVVADPSVSPRHSTFILQQEVVSVIDHSSLAGTFVNGKKISPGKYIILEESDVIAVGDLEVRIAVTKEAFPEETLTNVPAPEYEPAVPVGTSSSDNQDLKITTPASKEIPVESKMKTFKVQSTAAPTPTVVVSAKSKKKSKLKLGFVSYHSANTLVRIFAIVGDILLSYVVVEIFYPFDDFKQFISFVPETLFTLIDLQPQQLWEILLSDYPELKVIADDASALMTGSFMVTPILVSFILVRLSTTFLFGVSLSEFMMGMRAKGNGVWNRIGGVLRVLIGLITGPLLIFDLPALFSRRTFKEFMTFTNTDADSKSLTTFGLIAYYPLLAVLILVSPLLQGLELVEPIDVSTKIEKRIKVTTSPSEVEIPEGGIGAPVAPQPVLPPPPVEVSDGSKTAGFSLSYAPADVTIIPDFNFTGGNSLKYQTSSNFYLKEIQRPVQFQWIKNFDLKELLEIGLKGNFLLAKKFPELYAYTHETSDKSFQKPMDSKSQEAFAKEFIEFTKLSLGLTLDTALEVAKTDTFIFKNLVDYRAALLHLIEYKNFDQIGLIQIGDTVFFKVKYVSSKPFDILIPLRKGGGKMFKVTFDKKEKIKDASSKFYKFILFNSNWLNPTYPLTGDKFSALEVSDYFQNFDPKDKITLNSKAQNVYGYYFEMAAEILKRNDPVEYGLFSTSVSELVNIYRAVMRSHNKVDTDEDYKVVKNFEDLQEAIRLKNYTFFGLEQII